jgi:hypothetical protein
MWWPFSKKEKKERFNPASAAPYIEGLVKPLREEFREARAEKIAPVPLGIVEGYAATGAPKVEHVACLVTHGMGQQVPFETVGELVESLSQHEGMGNVMPKVNRVLLAEGQDPLTRMEVYLKGPAGKPDIQLHLYEGYWAPLTEGKVTFMEATKFLFSGASRGLVSSFRGKKFARWVFGEMREFPIKPGTFGDLLITVLFLGAGLGLAYWCQAKLHAAWDAAKAWVKRHPDLAHHLWEVAQRLWAGLMDWFGLLFHHPIAAAGSLAHGVAGSFSGSLHVVVGGIVLLFGALYVYLLNYFMVEFVGDVAIYISSHKVSKFEEVRTAIQKKIFNVASQIYSATESANKRKMYDRVILVGHSLGSVITYDLLNELIAWDRACHDGDMRVVSRTSRLITFGSPLDKTAFLFRTQVSPDHHYREAMAALDQPLVLSYALRPQTFEWVNIYSWADVVSGHLIYYDLPAHAKLPRDMGIKNPVRNEPAPEAYVPIYAHIQYWGGKTLREELWKAITMSSVGPGVE